MTIAKMKKNDGGQNGTNDLEVMAISNICETECDDNQRQDTALIPIIGDERSTKMDWKFLAKTKRNMKIKIDAVKKELLTTTAMISWKQLLTRPVPVILMISLFLCPLVAVSCHPILLTTTTSSNHLVNAEAPSMCTRDDHCDPGLFCYTLTKSCVPCLVDECLKWKRHSGATSCTRGKHDCGNCLPGYVENYGHCQAVVAPSQNEEENMASGTTMNESGFWKSDTARLVIGGVTLVCLIGIVAPLFVYIARKRKSQRSSSTSDPDKEGIVSEEEFLRPPPYNPYDFCDQQQRSTSILTVDHHAPLIHPEPAPDYTVSVLPRNPAGRSSEDECFTTAIAFDQGLFPTQVSPPAEGESNFLAMEIPNAPVPMEEEAIDDPGQEVAEPVMDPTGDRGGALGGTDDSLEIALGDSDAVVPEIPEDVPEQESGRISPPLFQIQLQWNLLVNGMRNGHPVAPMSPPPHPPQPRLQMSWLMSQSFFDLSEVSEVELPQFDESVDLDSSSDHIVPDVTLPDPEEQPSDDETFYS